MPLTIDDKNKAAILAQYERTMAAFPKKKSQVDSFLSTLSESKALCLQFLYGSMHPNDILSFPPERIFSYVKATLRAYAELSYVKTIPQEIFFPYVLSHRVNAEWLDFGRDWLLDQLLPFVQGKSMEEAALAVNDWCYAYATYAPTDNRTLGPLAVIASTLGRCGEESVLAVSALRSAGIPARQVYVPRWSHCDDNHAWVEVWIDGTWHYLGACEPEPVLDKGWFTAAASRAMLVHSKAWTCLDDTEAAYHGPVYTMVNATAHYADTVTLTVHVTNHGQPVPHIPVEFQIDNYSELFPIHVQETDETGTVRFVTGRGDLCVSVVRDGKLLLRRLDLRQVQQVELELEDARTPEPLPASVEFDLVPPQEAPQKPAQPVPQTHLDAMAQCKAHRMARKASFHTTYGDPDFAPYVEMARCNFDSLETFLHNDAFTKEEKLLVLQHLRPKDFVDLQPAVLEDALLTARPFRTQYPADIWTDYILAPRILDEMLLPERHQIKALFPDGFQSPAAIRTWMERNLSTVSDYHVQNFYPSVYGCLVNGQLPGYCFGLVFTALCRTFGFPARCNPVTRQAEWLEDGTWHGVLVQHPGICLTLQTEHPAPLHYEEHFTLGRWNGQSFETLNFSDVVLDKENTLRVDAGFYRLVTTTRQIDGTASVRLFHFAAEADRVVPVIMPADETAQRLKNADALGVLPEGEIKTILSQPHAPAQLLIFAKPGAEPTEHLLQELLECQCQYNQIACDVHIFADHQDDPTLKRVQAALSHVHIHLGWNEADLDLLHRTLGIGDQRLPFVLLQSREKRAVYGCANYNIRMAQTLLNIYDIISR